MKKFNTWTRLFYKIFISYIIVIVMPLTAFSYAHFNDSVKRIEKNTRERYLEDIKYYSDFFQSNMDKVYDCLFQISINTQVNKVLSKTENPSVYDIYTLINFLTEFTIGNDTIHSIALYIPSKEKVFTSGEGSYSIDYFYDCEIINAFVESKENAKWFPSRLLHNSFTPVSGVNVLTYAVKLPVNKAKLDSILLINLDLDAVLGGMLAKSDFKDIFVINESGELMVFDAQDSEVYKEFKINISTSNSKESQGIIRTEKSLLVYKKISQEDWTVVKYITIDEMSGPIKTQIWYNMKVFIGVLLFGVILSCIMANTRVHIWKRVGLKIIHTSKKTDVNNNNVYNIIENAVDSLVKYNVDIKDEIDRAKLILKDAIISDIIWNDFIDINELKERMEYVGITFRYPHYLAFVANINNVGGLSSFKTRNDLKTWCKKVILDEFSGVFDIAGGVMVDKDKLGFIMNIKEDKLSSGEKERIKLICKHINKIVMENMEDTIVFSFGNIVDNLSKVYESFIRARQRIMYRLITSDNTVLFNCESGNKFYFPTSIQKQFINNIMSNDMKAVEEAVETLFKKYIDTSMLSVDEVYITILLMISGVSNYFVQTGLNINIGDLNMFSIINKSRTSEELKSNMLQFFRMLLDARKKQEEKLLENDHVSRVIRFMKKNFDKDISVPDIASYICLHPSYLSRIFKETTGKTIMEFLTLIRIEKSKELLKNTDKTVKNISALIGYSDVRSYIRYFKKYEGVTPTEYRRNI